MKVWDVTLSCDHKMLVIAPTIEAAIAIARREAQAHGVEIDRSPQEVDLIPGLLVWYPGPLSRDAITDPEEPPGDNPWDSAFAGGPYSGGRNL